MIGPSFSLAIFTRGTGRGGAASAGCWTNLRTSSDPKIQIVSSGTFSSSSPLSVTTANRSERQVTLRWECRVGDGHLEIGKTPESDAICCRKWSLCQSRIRARRLTKQRAQRSQIDDNPAMTVDLYLAVQPLDSSDHLLVIRGNQLLTDDYHTEGTRLDLALWSLLRAWGRNDLEFGHWQIDSLG